MPRVIALVLAALLCGCADEAPRTQDFRSEEGQFSIAAPEGWTPSQELGSTVFHGPPDRGLGRTTIAIRSVPRWQDDRDLRPAPEFFAATERALRGLPDARITDISDVDDLELRGVSYELTFVPPGKTQRYARRHIALHGDKRIFHVIHTAPAGELARSASLFDDVVSSLREED